MKTVYLIVMFSLSLVLVQAQEKVMLWPDGKMPNTKGLNLSDSIANERVHRVGNPFIEVFLPSRQENKGCGVLIIAGGGYARLAHEISGRQIAKWLNTFGVAGFVLYHRLPTSPDLEKRELGPIQDAQRAMRVIRDNAQSWGLDTMRIGVTGCSAGGHLSATLGTYRDDVSDISDGMQRHSFRPDFMMLVSPVISLQDSWMHKGTRKNLLGENPSQELLDRFSLDRQVSDFTPMTILFHADNDTSVGSMNSISFYSALKANKIPASLHIFPFGKHSIALRNNPGSTNMWTEICETWMREMNLIEK